MVSGVGRTVAFESLGSSAISPWLYHRSGRRYSLEVESWKPDQKGKNRDQAQRTKAKSEEAKTCPRDRRGAPAGQKVPKSPGIVA